MLRKARGKREMRNSKKKNRAKVYGIPGTSANSNNALKQAYSDLSWGKKTVIFAAGAILGGLSSLAIGINPLLGASLIAGLILFLSSLFFNKGTWATLLLLATYALISIPLGGIMIAPVSQAQFVFAIEAGVSLFTAALLASWLSLRYGRVAPWKILIIALPLSSVLGLIMAYLIPGSGINVARISMMLVVAYGCGVLDWIISTVQMVKDKVSPLEEVESYKDTLILSSSAARKILSKAEQKTAQTLSNELGEGYSVFHDVMVKDSKSTISHLVIGSSGVVLIASIAPTGAIVETASAGLIIPGAEIGTVASDLVEQRSSLAKALKMRVDDIRLIIAVQDIKTDIKALGKSFAAFESDLSKLPTVRIMLLSNDMLTFEVAPGLDLISPATRNVLTHRAQTALLPASKRSTTGNSMIIAPITADGKIMKPVSMDVAQDWIRVGNLVKLVLKDKIVENVRIHTEPYTNENNEIIIGLVLQEEWDIAEKSGEKPEVFSFPVSSLRK
jgi:hypothetical protein